MLGGRVWLALSAAATPSPIAGGERTREDKARRAQRDPLERMRCDDRVRNEVGARESNAPPERAPAGKRLYGACLRSVSTERVHGASLRSVTTERDYDRTLR